MNATTTNATTTATKTVTEMRAEFEKFAKIGRSAAGTETWDAAVKTLAMKMADGRTLTPEVWVKAAELATTRCDKCRGTGTYSWGACVNGVMTHSGLCNRCHGKGQQDQDDYRRNYGYDNYAVRAAFSAMVNAPEQEQDTTQEPEEEQVEERIGVYKGKKYRLKFLGRTKHGYRACLEFWNGTKTFWVDGDAVSEARN